MATSKRKTSGLSVNLDPDTKSKLLELTDNGRLSQNHVIREGIQRMHAMAVKHVPMCANGNACHCPHTHQFPPRS